MITFNLGSATTFFLEDGTGSFIPVSPALKLTDASHQIASVEVSISSNYDPNTDTLLLPPATNVAINNNIANNLYGNVTAQSFDE
ncbi:MAG: hypothetical protein EB015_11380 [Methylocystaceae bacterium]|nr:hypothetical protein [Methylocystaceae bacterium]